MKLTERDMYLFKILSKYENETLEERIIDHEKFIDTLLYLLETLAEKKIEIENWKDYSETLLHKIISHSLSFQQILKGFIFKSEYFDLEMNMLDISSAKVILRAQFETFLMYHHIYVNPKTDDVKQFRYNIWIYSALLQRQIFPAEDESSQKQKSKDLDLIREFKTLIEEHPLFKSLIKKQKESLLEYGNGRFFYSWSKIMLETGFAEGNLFKTLYSYLSMYAHSEGLSIIQMKESPSFIKTQNNINQARLDIHNSRVILCITIMNLVNTFDEIRSKYSELNENFRTEIEFYNKLGTTKLE